MPIKHETRLPWRERDFVRLSEAALIAGRSRTWVENQITAGRIEARRFEAGGLLTVTTESLARLVDGAQETRGATCAKPIKKRHLQLVVSNP